MNARPFRAAGDPPPSKPPKFPPKPQENCPPLRRKPSHLARAEVKS
jgi:hypothetical protein